MKVAYLVWEFEDDEFPILVPEDSRKLDYCARKVRIVYYEVTQ